MANARRPRQLDLPETYHPISGVYDALHGLRGLSDKARLTYLVVAGFESHGNTAHFSMPTLAGLLGCAVSTAVDAVVELEEQGYVQRKQRWDPKNPKKQMSNLLVLLRDPAGMPLSTAPASAEQEGAPSDAPDPKQQDLNSDDPKATTADVEKPVEESSEIEELRQRLADIRAGEVPLDCERFDQEATREGPGLHKTGPERAALTTHTLARLMNTFGTDRTAKLEQAFASARWRAPQVAEAGAQLLLERHLKKTIRVPKAYVETLYAEAVARAQKLELGVPMPGVRPAPKPRGTEVDSLEDLQKYRLYLHKRIDHLQQTHDQVPLGDNTEEANRLREELRRVCGVILRKTVAAEAKAS